MTSLTPFRLFQLCKYALQAYASNSPLIIRTRRKADSVKQLYLASKRNRKRHGHHLVGSHVEERRGWDTKPHPMQGRPSVLGQQHVDASASVDAQRASSEYPLAGSSSSLDATRRHPSTSDRDLARTLSSHGGRHHRQYPNEITRLMADPTLFKPSFQAPRNVIVLCHGLYGFSTATPIPLFPSLKLHYWASVLEVLREKLGCKVMVVGVKGTGSIQERALEMDAWLKEKLPKGTGVNFVAHSMGGLDCRYLITHLKPETYTPLSLTMIGTPNRGSPFMDWCAANIGVGLPSMTKAAVKAAASGALPPYSLKSPLLSRTLQDDTGSSPTQREQRARADESSSSRTASSSGSALLAFPSLFGSSVVNYLLGIFDSPAYGNLTTHYLNETFNPATPDSPNVKYLSVAGRTDKMSVLHPLWFPKLILDAAAERGYAEEKGKSGKFYEGNDGLVSVSSAKWGEWLGTVDRCHHWDLRGEGGILPNGPSLADKPEGRPDPNAPGGWDWTWKSDFSERALEAQKAKMGATQPKQEKEGEALLNAQAIEKLPEMVKKATGSASRGWDMSQVGQVIDWVADHLPGGSDQDCQSHRSSQVHHHDHHHHQQHHHQHHHHPHAIGSKQLADAAREKAGEQYAAAAAGPSASESIGSSMTDHVASRANMKQTGDTGSRDKEHLEKSAGEFDLGRFYGGLMVKLREEGF